VPWFNDIHISPLLLRVGPVRCNRSRHNSGETSRYILILFRCFDTREDLLDTNTNLCASCDFLNLTDSALLVLVWERTGFPENVRKLRLRVDVRHGDLGIKAAEEIQLG
jgi:hypothetical protein